LEQLVKQYRKGLIALAGFLTVLGGVLSDGSVSTLEWGALATAAATAFGVYRVPNEPDPEVAEIIQNFRLSRNVGG
jgi:hypothetical protein